MNYPRRAFIRKSAVATAASLISVQSGARAKSIDTRIISQQPDIYCGWPTLTRRKNGQLLVAFSGGREAHVCPFGRVDLIRSDDNGETWTFPRTIYDGPIDDRDAGIMETAEGTLLATTFTSLAYEKYLPNDQRQPRWLSAHGRIPQEKRIAELGEWMMRSTDGGITWSERYPSFVNSPHGPTQLRDGRLLYAGKRLWAAAREIGVCESRDDGKTWNWLANIPTRFGDHFLDYHELHAVEAADGRIVVHIRNHNPANKGETLQSESMDGGKTWSRVHGIGVWGLPSFLTRLRDGRLLMSYGHRRAPFGIQARVSTDHGGTWSAPILISKDGANGDLGYPSSVELEDGSLLTVWYENPGSTHSNKAVLRQARWTLES